MRKASKEPTKFRCKFCKKLKSPDQEAMIHIGEPVCRDCMEKGW